MIITACPCKKGLILSNLLSDNIEKKFYSLGIILYQITILLFSHSFIHNFLLASKNKAKSEI